MRVLATSIVFGILVSCGGSKDQKVTREDCAKVADHIAEVMIADYAKQPDVLWDAVHAEEAEPDLPATVTKESFKGYLDSPEGKTWLMKRHAEIRTGTEMAIDGCMQKATRKDITCLLASKTRDDVVACDKAKQATSAK
jgi:hypothetical protein